MDTACRKASMKKKDPVLWVVVDRDGHPWMFERLRNDARKHADSQDRVWSPHAPFRVVKYLPAPKTKRKRKA